MNKFLNKLKDKDFILKILPLALFIIGYLIFLFCDIIHFTDNGKIMHSAKGLYTITDYESKGFSVVADKLLTIPLFWCGIAGILFSFLKTGLFNKLGSLLLFVSPIMMICIGLEEHTYFKGISVSYIFETHISITGIISIVVLFLCAVIYFYNNFLRKKNK